VKNILLTNSSSLPLTSSRYTACSQQLSFPFFFHPQALHKMGANLSKAMGQ
jgi:hypothetical protein